MIRGGTGLAVRGLRDFSAWGKRHPTMLNVAAGTVLGGTGDVLAQVLEGAEHIDAKRTACVCAWYGPAALFFWTPYMNLAERLYGSSGMKSVVCKAVSYNIAMATVDITGFHIVSLTPQVGFEKAVTTLKEGYSETVVAGLSLWGPAMTLIFWKVPVHLRMSTSYALDVVWASTMSYLSQRKKKQVEAEAANQVEATLASVATSDIPKASVIVSEIVCTLPQLQKHSGG